MSNSTIPTISEIQEEIIKEFQSLDGSRESMLTYIMELGEKMIPMEEAFKNEHNTIKGCMSKVWLRYDREDDRLFFEGDSNTAITKGLISLILRVLSGQTIEGIIDANLYFVGKIGLSQLIGSQRAGGFGSMIRQIKLIAIAQKAKNDY